MAVPRPIPNWPSASSPPPEGDEAEAARAQYQKEKDRRKDEDDRQRQFQDFAAALQHSHLGNELMTKIKEDMKEIGKVELHPKFDGKQMIMVIQPL